MSAALPTAEYRQLLRWFPTLSDRARALGRSRETLTSWERGLLACAVKPSTAGRIARVGSVAGDVESLVGDPRAAGRWMLTPQPQLGGTTPVQMIAAGRLDELSGLIYRGREIAPQRRIRRASRAPGDVVAFPRQRERGRSADEAAVLRRIGEAEELIGPILDE